MYRSLKGFLFASRRNFTQNFKERICCYYIFTRVNGFKLLELLKLIYSSKLICFTKFAFVLYQLFICSKHNCSRSNYYWLPRSTKNSISWKHSLIRAKKWPWRFIINSIAINGRKIIKTTVTNICLIVFMCILIYILP